MWSARRRYRDRLKDYEPCLTRRGGMGVRSGDGRIGGSASVFQLGTERTMRVSPVGFADGTSRRGTRGGAPGPPRSPTITEGIRGSRRSRRLVYPSPERSGKGGIRYSSSGSSVRLAPASTTSGRASFDVSGGGNVRRTILAFHRIDRLRARVRWRSSSGRTPTTWGIAGGISPSVLRGRPGPLRERAGERLD